MRSLAVMLAFLVTSGIPSLTAQQRRCAESTTPKTLPAPSALVDSARALAAVSGHVAPPDQLLFSLLFTPTDSFPLTRPTQASGARAAQVLSGFMRPQEPRGFWAVRVRVLAGATPALTLERAVYCPPVPTPESYAPERVPVQVGSRDQLPLRRRVRLVFEVAVDETGYPTTVRLLRASGIRELDEQITHEWERRRFLPALLDGTAIPSVYHTDGRPPKQ